MSDFADSAAWTAFFLGLALMATGLGEWRTPGTFGQVAAELERSAFARLTLGAGALAIGAAVILQAEPGWADPLRAGTAIGGAILVAAGLGLLAAGERFAVRLARLGAQLGAAGIAALAGSGALLLFGAIARIPA